MTDFDLRHAFARHYFGMPKRPQRAFENDDVDDLDDSADNAGGEGEAQEDDNDSEEDVKDPDKKRLSNEAAKYRRERNNWRKRAEEAEEKLTLHKKGEADETDSTDTIKHLRLELSFERLAMKARISDIEAAWRLVEDDLQAVKVEDDHVDAERMGQIVDHVVERYPYLRDDYAPKGGSDSGSSDGDPSSSPSVQSGASGASVVSPI